MTLGDALSISQVKDTSLTSVEELQNLAGGADIKVLLSSFLNYYEKSLYYFPLLSLVLLQTLLDGVVGSFSSFPILLLLSCVGFRSCSRQGCSSGRW